MCRRSCTSARSAAPRTGALVDKYRGTIEGMGHTPDWYDSYSSAIRVTPERSWTIPG